MPWHDNDGSAILPQFAFQSEKSLGLYRSGASTVAMSYGTLALTRLVMNGDSTNGPDNIRLENSASSGGKWQIGEMFNAGSLSLRCMNATAPEVLRINSIYMAPGTSGAVDLGTIALPFGTGHFSSGISAKASILSSSYVSSSRTVMGGEVWGSGISIGGGGTLIPAISSISSKVGAFVVQGSASSFTIITWAAVQPGDQIMVTPFGAAVSSLSSGLVAHSHCTKTGQVELRLSNVSTLAQNQSSISWFLTRISPF